MGGSGCCGTLALLQVLGVLAFHSFAHTSVDHVGDAGFTGSSWSRPPRSRCREERAGAVGVVVSEKWSLNRFVALHVRSGYHPQTDHGPAGDSA